MAEEDLISGDQQINGKTNLTSVIENGFYDEPDFSDPEDFVDDITDEGMDFLCIYKTELDFRPLFIDIGICISDNCYEWHH